MIIGPGIKIGGGIYVDSQIGAGGGGGGGSIVTSGLQFNLQTAPSSGTTWTDASGNGYHATLQGSASYVSNNGGGIKLNNSNFVGTDYISVPYNIASNTVTVEVIASFNPTTNWATIWGNELYNTGRGYFAYMSTSTSMVYGKPSGPAGKTITASNAIRQWYFVINGTSHDVYLNNVKVGTTDTVTTQTLFTTNNFYFGSRHNNDGTGATDKMNNSTASLQPVFYQMRVYNKALSVAEMTQNYNAVKATYGI
jgi:hypothetical protein